MNGMFFNANSFNQSLDSWDVSNVIDMTFIFNNNNPPPSSWNISNNTFL